MTSDLRKRIQEHKNSAVEGFTHDINYIHYVYYKCGDSIAGAIEEKKRIKAGSRKKKLCLIEGINPDWKDLAEDL